MSILAIADALNVHPNTVRFHLDMLVGDGQVEQAAPGRKGPGRPPLMFQAVRRWIAAERDNIGYSPGSSARPLPPNGIRATRRGPRGGSGGSEWNRHRTVAPEPR